MNDHLRFLPQATSILKDEKGVVLISALMILVLLTIIGIASTNVSNTETKIATSEAIYQQNLYRAEGATLETVEIMEDPDFNPKIAHDWIYKSATEFTEDNLYKPDFWDGKVDLGGTTGPVGSVALPDTHTSIFVIYEGIAYEETGETLELNIPKIHSYAIYGHCQPPNRGATTIEIGYLKPY
jgi:hypothetical protein